ncbi:phage tail length tape measure family protein [Comamonas sp. JUb58]|uniref:phage tail length tape measure family protein n=1 Tax=Comamonas sp. JUb58 TaxID=2485114 RepID=UPI0010612171|nr:phage tail length tape measure family protein [Comamonas sp. JUb58]TDS68173.1 tail length tape measure protein [Comamonas sp. JUb58]
MSTENQKFGFTVAAENEASQTFQQIGNDADKMANKVNQAGQKAAEGVGAIGDGAENAAERLTRAESRIASAMRKATEETLQAAQAAKSLSGSFELKMDMRGMDASRLQPYIKALRDAESELSVFKAAEAEVGRQNVFAEKHRQAQQLAKSAEYVRFWNEELDRMAAAEKRAASENAFLSSLREQSSAISKTRADLLELQAAQMGVAAQAAPMIAKLREAEGGVGKVGMSAAAMSAALRNVPAQFTDIVVSLQAGQAPLTVLLQQGGQLKDMFGGVGAASKALGGYVLGLVNPLTIAGAAVGILALAYSEGVKEQDAFVRSIALSGNVSGVTTSQLRDYARQIDSVAGTQAKAAESLALFVAQGVRGNEQLRQYTQTAIEWEKLTGQAVEETAKKFSELQKDPLAAVLKLNEGTNFLTVSIYEQIKSLEDQGRSADASRVAMDALDTAMRDRSKTIKENLGYIEQGWNSIKGAAKEAWDAMLGVGRKATIGDQLAAAQKQLAERTAKSDVVGDDAAWQRGNKLLEERISGLQGLLDKEKDAADASAFSAQALKSRTEWESLSEQSMSKSEKMTKALTEARIKYNKELANLPAPDMAGRARLEQEYEKINASIREQYKEKSPSKSGGVSMSDTRLSGLEAQLEAARQYGKQLQELGLAAKDLNAGERESLKISAELEKATDAKTVAKLKSAKATADEIGQQLRSNGTTEDNLKAKDALIKSMYKSADATAQETARLEASLSVYGKSQVEIERLTLAKLQQHKADVGLIANLEYIAALEKQIQEQAGKVGGLERTELKKFTETIGKSLEAAKEELAIQQDGLSLLGMDEVARRKILAVRKITLDVAKQIAEVDKTKYSDDDDENERQRAARRKLIWEKSEVDTQVAIGKIQEEYALKNAEKYNDIFRQGFADFVNNGADGLKAFGKSLKTTILTSASDALYQAFAQKFVMNVAANVTGLVGAGAGWLASLFGGGDSASSGGGGLMSLLSNGSSAYSLYSGEGLLGQGSRYAANLMGWGGSAAWSAPGVQASGAVTMPVSGSLGGAAPGSTSFMGLNGGYAAAGVMMIPLIAAYLGGMFKEEKQVGSGITGELGGDLYGYQLMRESGGLFDGPDYRYVVAEKEIEKSKAEIERLKKEIADNPNDARNGYRERQLQQQYSRLEMLSQYDGSIEASKGPIKILQDAFMAMREDTASRADSLGLDGDAIRAMKVTLGLDEIHPDTGGKGLELTGLTQEEASAKIQAALAQANEEMARSVLGKWEDQTREITRTVWDNVELPTDGDTQQYGRVGREVTETITEQVFVMSEYVRTGETAVQALTRLSDSLHSVNTVFDMLGLTLMDTSLAGADMASDIIDAFGGADKFTAATGNYYDKFYTDQEKVQNQTRLLNDQLKKLGIETMPASREAFKEYINGIDRSTEEGQKLFASLLGLVDVFDMIYTSAENIASLKGDLQIQLLRAKGNDAEATRLERAKQIKELEKYNDPELVKLQVEIWDTEDKAKADEAAKTLAQQNLQAAISREKEYWNQFAADAKDAFTKASSYVDLFKGSAKSLRAGLDDMANSQAAAGMVYIEQALENARRGLGFGDYDQTQSAINAATGGLVMDNYATQAELDYDKKVLAGQLDELGEFAELAKTDAQKQIDLANAQIKRLDDTLSYWTEYGKEQIDATLSVTDAIKALEKLMFPEKDAAGAGGSAASSGRGGASFGGGGGSIISGNSSENMFDGYLPDGRPVYKDGSIGTAMDGTADKIAKGQDPYSNVPGYSGSGKVVYDKEKGMYVPKLNVGTNYLPSDMLVLAHQGERIIPKADNHALMAALGNQGGPAVQMAEVVAELRAVKQELQAIKAGQGEVAYQARKTASVLSSVTDGGLGMRNQPATA